MDGMSSPDPGSAYCQRNPATYVYLVLSSLLLLVNTILVPLRLYTRLWIVHGFWWDDVLIAIAYLLSIPGSALEWRVVQLGLGTHIGCHPLQDTQEAGRITFIALPVVIFSQIASRASVALFVTRIFAVTKPMRILLYIFTVWMALSLIVTTALNQRECSPTDATWNPALAPIAKCWSPVARQFLSYYNGAVGIFSDFVLAFLPAYFLVKLQMSPTRRCRLIALMGLGLVPGICAALRTGFTFAQNSNDVTYTGSIEAVFAALELEMLIVAACIPTLPPLFQREKRKARYPPSMDEITLFSNPLRQLYLRTSSRSHNKEQRLERSTNAAGSLSSTHIDAYTMETGKRLATSSTTASRSEEEERLNTV